MLQRAEARQRERERERARQRDTCTGRVGEGERRELEVGDRYRGGAASSVVHADIVLESVVPGLEAAIR